MEGQLRTTKSSVVAVDAGFVDDILRWLSALGAISSKPMFGGIGVFIDGKMFLRISRSNIVSFKADDENRSTYVNAGMKKSGKMPYYEATADQVEDPDVFLEVAQLARDAALR